MRESRTKDRKKLPGSVYEAWLGKQRPERAPSAHKAPPPDIYEAWVEGEVRRKALAGMQDGD